MKIQVKRDNEKLQLPNYANPGDAGMDVRADIERPIVLNTLERAIIPTGIKMAIPDGYEMQVRPRSGLAAKHGISVCNTPGTIGSKFRNTICVILINLSTKPFVINPGDRIAQIVLNKFETIEWEEVDELDETERGLNGFGSSGTE